MGLSCSYIAAAVWGWLALAAPDGASSPRTPDPAAADPGSTQDAEPAPANDAEQRQRENAEQRTEARAQRRRAFTEPGGPPDRRKWMIGIEGVVAQAASLRPEVVYLDPRFIGRSVAMGGVGAFGRYRPSPYLGFDLGVRSGSVRYQARDEDDQVSQDQILADVGMLVYLGRGEIAQFALSGGVGGLYNRIGYDLGDRDGVQTFGSGLVRIGGEAEFVVKRVAFVLSFRTYGVFTDRDATRTRGAVFASRTVDDRAPVASLQTMILGAAGIAYRF